MQSESKVLRIISKKQVSEIADSLPITDLLSLTQQAFYSVSNGLGDSPHRLAIQSPSCSQLIMPASINDIGSSIKIVGIPKFSNGLQSSTLVLNNEDGRLDFVVNSESLTAIRTAAGSALATKLFSSLDSSKLVIFGSGVQAYWHAKLMIKVRPTIKIIKIVNRTKTNAEALVTELSKEFSELSISAHQLDSSNKGSLANLVDSADIICSCTPSKEAFIFGDLLKEGCHLNCVGSYTPEMREFDIEVIKNSLLLVDSKDMVEIEAGEIIHAKNQEIPFILYEIGKLVHQAGEKALTELDSFEFNEVELDQLKKENHKFTLFKSVGVAAQDVTLTHHICDVAVKKQLFTEISFF